MTLHPSRPIVTPSAALVLSPSSLEIAFLDLLKRNGPGLFRVVSRTDKYETLLLPPVQAAIVDL